MSLAACMRVTAPECVCLLQTIHIACFLQSSCSCAPLLSQQCSVTDSLRVSPRILWYSRGLISKLLEVGFDLALKALISPVPASILQCYILAHI